jgi:hypothetical protein
LGDLAQLDDADASRNDLGLFDRLIDESFRENSLKTSSNRGFLSVPNVYPSHHFQSIRTTKPKGPVPRHLSQLPSFLPQQELGAHFHHTIHSLEELSEDNFLSDPLKKDAAKLMTIFYAKRKERWATWKEAMPQEPPKMRKGSKIHALSENESKETISNRIDRCLEAISLPVATLDGLCTILLGIREGTESKKGEELLKLLVTIYAGNTEESLSRVIERILVGGMPFLAIYEDITSASQSFSKEVTSLMPSTSRSEEVSPNNSNNLATIQDQQQSSGQSFLVWRVPSVQPKGSRKSSAKPMNFRLGFYNENEAGSGSTENSWGTYQNTLVKLAAYLLDGASSYKCFVWYVQWGDMSHCY